MITKIVAKPEAFAIMSFIIERNITAIERNNNAESIEISMEASDWKLFEKMKKYY